LECGESVSCFDGMLLGDVLLTGGFGKIGPRTPQKENSSCDVGIRTAISFFAWMFGKFGGWGESVTENRNGWGVSCERGL
jgi:hypothetical protein